MTEAAGVGLNMGFKTGVTMADVNGDGRLDIYSCRTSTSADETNADRLYINMGNRLANGIQIPVFEELSKKYGLDDNKNTNHNCFFDFDRDGDLDLLVISGGAAHNLNDPAYMTRQYLNDGQGNFSRTSTFPIIRTNAGALLIIDIDGDQDMDVIIGGLSSPGMFPKAPKSFLLRNDKGKFVDITQAVFPDLDGLGMITDIEAGDLDGDGSLELVFAGDWMAISVFSFDGSTYRNKTKTYGLEKSNGWWKCISLEDKDADGDIDLVAGNMGLNHRLKATHHFPVTLISNDFDGNGSTDPVMCFYHNAKLYPFAGRDALIAQIPALKKKFLRYTPYANATIDDIFSVQELELIRMGNGREAILTGNNWGPVELSMIKN